MAFEFCKLILRFKAQAAYVSVAPVVALDVSFGPITLNISIFEEKGSKDPLYGDPDHE